MGTKAKRTSGARPRLPKVDAEMQRWCALIEDDLRSWPDVTTRPMFGLIGYYRRGVIFAAIPRTRAVDTPYSVLIKLRRARDEKLSKARAPGAGWSTFEMHAESDLPQVLSQLAAAYDNARRARRTPRRG